MRRIRAQIRQLSLWLVKMSITRLYSLQKRLKMHHQQTKVTTQNLRHPYFKHPYQCFKTNCQRRATSASHPLTSLFLGSMLNRKNRVKGHRTRRHLWEPREKTKTYLTNSHLMRKMRKELPQSQSEVITRQVAQRHNSVPRQPLASWTKTSAHPCSNSQHQLLSNS